MYLHTAFEKIVNKHGRKTYAEVEWYFPSRGYARRLDLELEIAARDRYEHDQVFCSHRPLCKTYRLSLPRELGSDLVRYDIYHADEETGEMILDAIVSVFTTLEYENEDWRETFNETKYSRRCYPWWLKKDL